MICTRVSPMNLAGGKERIKTGTLLPVVFLSLFPILLHCGCSSLGRPWRATESSTDREHVQAPFGLAMEGPHNDDWQTLTTQSGKYYVYPKDGASDVIFLYGNEVNLTHELTRIDQLFANLGTNPEFVFDDLRIDNLYGTDVIRFETFERDGPQSSENLVGSFNLGMRRTSQAYFTRTRGVFILHPQKSQTYLKVACARSSYHGFIGAHYDDLAENFIRTFIVSNQTGWASPTAASVLQGKLPEAN